MDGHDDRGKRTEEPRSRPPDTLDEQSLPQALGTLSLNLGVLKRFGHLARPRAGRVVGPIPTIHFSLFQRKAGSSNLVQVEVSRTRLEPALRSGAALRSGLERPSLGPGLPPPLVPPFAFVGPVLPKKSKTKRDEASFLSGPTRDSVGRFLRRPRNRCTESRAWTGSHPKIERIAEGTCVIWW